MRGDMDMIWIPKYVIQSSDLIFSRLECIRGDSCKYSMGQKNDLHAFGYNSAESEPI